MSETDGALISHLDDLQARLSRVAALSTPVDVVVGSARSSPARALETRAAQSPRPTPRSPVASPALEGRAAYHQTRDIVPRREATSRAPLQTRARGLGDDEETPVDVHDTTRDASRHDRHRERRSRTFVFQKSRGDGDARGRRSRGGTKSGFRVRRAVGNTGERHE